MLEDGPSADVTMSHLKLLVALLYLNSYAISYAKQPEAHPLTILKWTQGEFDLRHIIGRFFQKQPSR